MPKMPSTTGCSRIEPPSGTGVAGGMNGVRFAASMKKTPTPMISTQTASLTATSTLVSREDWRIPSTATIVSRPMIRTAPMLTGAVSPNSTWGSPKRFAR